MVIDGGDLLATDLCIVGAGPVGLALATKCAGRGLTVSLVDGGDFSKRPGWQGLFGAGDLATAHHASRDHTGHRGIGGTSRLWGGRCVTLDDIDFIARPHVPYSGWPIGHDEIVRYYHEALRFLGFAAGEDELPPVPDLGEAASAASLERWAPEPDLAKVYSARLRAEPMIRLHTGCTVTDIRLNPDGSRVIGLTAKWHGRTVELEAKAYVLAAGGLDNARLLLKAQRTWPHKFGGPDGPLGRFYTGHLTGYLASVQFTQPHFGRTLWFYNRDDGSYVKRRLALTSRAQTQHHLLNTAFWLDSFSIADPAHGSGALSMLYLALATLRIYPRLGRGLAPSPTPLERRGHQGHLTNIRQDPHQFISTLQVLAQLRRQPFRKRGFALLNPRGHYLLRYHAEQFPDPENRVSLLERHDGSELPSLRINFRFQTEDAQSVVQSHDVLDRALQTADLGRLEYLAEPDKCLEHVLKQALDGDHQIGLTRMSEDRKQGVVNSQCRVHDVANLYVAGSSVFPTAGQANPTLAAVALALRLADDLLAAKPFMSASRPCSTASR
jgi:choline dehydrogenase-like flavoprotein